MAIPVAKLAFMSFSRFKTHPAPTAQRRGPFEKRHPLSPSLQYSFRYQPVYTRMIVGGCQVPQQLWREKKIYAGNRVARTRVSGGAPTSQYIGLADLILHLVGRRRLEVPRTNR